MIVKRRKSIQQVQQTNQDKRVNIGVKIRVDLWRELRALSIKQGRLSGELLDEAISDYLKKMDKLSLSNQDFKLRLHHVHIFASDIRTTLKFWQDMFGAQILFDAKIAGVRNVMIAVGSGRINIYDQVPRPGGGGAYHHLGIKTDALESLITHMEEKGFSFQGSVREYGYLRYMMAMAPDNILLELFQILPENAPASFQQIIEAFD